MSNTLPKLTIATARTILAGLGMTLMRGAPGEFRVNFRDDRAATAYYTDDLQDAVDTARHMAANRVPDMAPPPVVLYFIQERAPAGNYFDSIGFRTVDPKHAALRLREWQAAFPTRICRLIARNDTVIAS
jgi:hypothetical protein